MTMLVLQSVTKRYSTARREYVALRDVSLDIDRGELVAVWGVRRSGRSTLLRIAGGIERPDEGSVSFCGQDLGAEGTNLLGRTIGYCSAHFIASQGGTVLDHVAVGPLAVGTGRDRARALAGAALERVEASDCANLEPRLLDPAEITRVAIARALVSEPTLLLIDEPTSGVDLLQRDEIMRLIRSIADDGTTILMTLGEAVTMADRVLSMDNGELRGDVTPEQAPVVSLRRSRIGRSA